MKLKICILIAALFFISCAHPNHETRIKASLTSAGESFASADWEPKPRSLGAGNGAQLGIRASEGIIMLYAAHNEEGKQDLFLASSRNMGDSFSKPIRVNSEAGELNAHGENDPQLRSGTGSGIYALWEGDRDIKFSRSVNFGRSFSAPIRVNDNDQNDQKVSRSFLTMEIAPDGAVYAAWLDGRDWDMQGTSSLYVARSTDKGVTFGKNVRVAGNICPCCRPAMAIGGSGEVFISWRHVYEGNERVIVVASSPDGGTTWSEPVRVGKGWTLNGCAHSGPVLGYVDGKLIVAWYTAEDGQPVLRAARSADRGKTFEISQNISGRVHDATHPHLAIIQNEAWVVFQGRDPNTGGGWDPAKTWLVRIPPNGSPTQPEYLPSTGEGVVYPRIFPGTGGRVYAAWTEIDDKGPKLMLCRGRIRQ